MGKRGSEDDELFKMVEATFQESDNDVTLALKVTKSQAGWGALSRSTSKPRILAVTCKRSSTTQRFNVSIHVLKYSSNGLQPAKMYKLKHLSKVEVVPSDPTGCSFVLGFDNMKIQGVPPEWRMRNVGDRNRFLTTIIRLCKENHHRVPKIIGIDVVEMALWEQARADSTGDANKADSADREQVDNVVTVEKELVSKAEEDDMENLLGTYVLGIDETEEFSERLKRELVALESANVYAIMESEPLVEEVLKRLNLAEECAEDMDEWLGIFNVKIKHMREDIESIESRNNMLEMQVHNNAALEKELSRLLERLRVPSQFAAVLTTGPFDESRMPQNVDACDWLSGALRGLEPPLLDPAYANMRAVKEKRAELEKLRLTFVRRASEFLRNYFSSLVDFMLSDKTYFSQRGQLKRPDHADLRYKCRTYARLLQHLKSLDKNSLGPLRKAYCQSLNLLLRREAREFANELRASTKVSRSQAAWMDGSTGGSASSGSGSETSTASDAYAKMLRIFIPLLVDESAFFASFMCYEVLPLAPPKPPSGDEKSSEDDLEEDISPMNMDGTDAKPTEQNAAEMEALNQALQELLDGIQDDFYAVVDWAYKIDPLRCITMQGTTEKYLSSHKADAAGFVRRLLSDLQARISSQFSKFIDDACHQIERHDRSVRQTGVLSYIPRFASLAQRMEGLLQGGISRDMVDLAYSKLIETMFSVLERIAKADPKYSDVLLLENYAAFQNGMFDVANMVPTLARYYQRASESYEQACTRYVNTIINTQFEKLFQFAHRVESLLYTITPEEVPFQLGVSKNELRKLLKSSLAGVEKSLYTMSKRMQKNLTSEELMPNLWEKCKIDFIDKYESLEALLQKCYPTETLSPSSSEMKELFKTV